MTPEERADEVVRAFHALPDYSGLNPTALSVDLGPLVLKAINQAIEEAEYYDGKAAAYDRVWDFRLVDAPSAEYSQCILDKWEPHLFSDGQVIMRRKYYGT